GAYNQYEIRRAESGESMENPRLYNEPGGERRCYQRSRSETGYCHAGDEATLIGEPFYESGNGDDITEAESGAADYTVSKVEYGKSVVGEAGQEDSQTVKCA